MPHVNVKTRVKHDGVKYLVAKNPHEVSAKVAKHLVDMKLAVEVAAPEKEASGGKVVTPGDPTKPLAEWTVPQLKLEAEAIAVEGFADLRKDELIAAIEAKRAETEGGGQ